MKRVRQRLQRDCFFCSVAMAAGLRYEKLGERVGWEVMSRVGDGGSQDDGTEDADWIKILRAGGFELGKNIHRVWTAPGYVGTQIIRGLLWGRRAILDTYLHGRDNHAVYWDGEKLWDPLGPKHYRTLNDIHFIQHAFLIRDENNFRPEVIEDEPEDDEVEQALRPRRPTIYPVRALPMHGQDAD